jgi:hypothetical protein
MQNRPSIHRQLVSIILLLSFSFGLQAQTNQVSNPGFTNSFLNWNQFIGRVGEWSPEDANNSPSSGSALLRNEGTSVGVVPLVLFQCFQVPGNIQIEFGGDLLVLPGQATGTAAFIFIEQFDNADCFESPSSSDSVSNSFVGNFDNWERVSKTANIDINTQSIRLALGVFKLNGETQDAEAFFDNIFLFLPDPGEFVINPAMSASFYNPSESGHGVMIHIMDANMAWMCWFSFTLTGEPAWICAVGQISGDTITFDNAFVVEGGAFPPNFDPAQIVEVPWGTIVIVFAGCDSGTMTWSTSFPGFASGSMPLVRLTPLWGFSCP